MVFLIHAHLLKDCPGFFILGWQLFEVFIQMLAHLMFGRRNETEADFVADQPGNGAYSE
ncbi:hypothetical protein D3C84_1190970 [compost metagenome]